MNIPPQGSFVRIAVPALAVAGALAVAIFFFSGYEITNFPPKSRVVIAFGDSLIAGAGASPGRDLVSLLEAATGAPIEGLGVPGDTTGSALARIPEALAADPGIAIVLLGGNDAIRRIPKEKTEANLREIVGRFQEGGAAVLLLGVRGGLLGDPYDDMYEDVARSTGSLYVPDVLDGIFGDARYMSDAVHPNDEGYQKIAARVAPVLADALSRAGR